MIAGRGPDAAGRTSTPPSVTPAPARCTFVRLDPALAPGLAVVGVDPPHAAANIRSARPGETRMLTRIRSVEQLDRVRSVSREQPHAGAPDLRTGARSARRMI